MRVAAIVFSPTLENTVPIAEACLRFSPQLCIQRKNTLFIEIGKCRTIYREETFLARLRLLLAKFGLSAKIAIGDSMLDALVLALHGTLDPARLSLGCFPLYLDLYETDPKSSGIAQRMIDNLAQVGITRVSQFMQLPTSEIPGRFGAAGLLIRARILGEMESGWPLWVAQEKIIEHIELYENDHCQTLEPLLFYLKPVLDRAFSRLWGRGLRASSIKLSLRLEKFSTVKEPIREWTMEFILPQSTARGTLPIIRERLERDLARKPLESSVIGIDLQILQSMRGYSGQKNFFHSREEQEEIFNSALSQLSEGLGKGKVFRASIHEEAVAERSWSRTLEQQKNLPDLTDYIPERPTRLLSRPERIQLADELLFIRKRPRRILSWSAVEKIDTDWLGERVERNYYRVDLEGKPPVWIFKNLKDEYYLHGYFE